jgi:hypothetical protein
MRIWRRSTLAAVLTVVMTGTVFAADTVTVFRYDGSLHCGMGPCPWMKWRRSSRQ